MLKISMKLTHTKTKTVEVIEENGSLEISLMSKMKQKINYINYTK